MNLLLGLLCGSVLMLTINIFTHFQEEMKVEIVNNQVLVSPNSGRGHQFKQYGFDDGCLYLVGHKKYKIDTILEDERENNK